MIKQSQEHDLTRGSVWKILIRFTIPIFLGTIFQALYTTADAIIIGRFAGKEALAAIEAVSTMIRIPINFFVGLSSGAGLIISQYCGAHEKEKIEKSIHNALSFSLLSGIFLSLLVILLSPKIITLIHVPPGIQEDAQNYVWIYFSAMTALLLYNMGSGILRAMGNSKTPFYFLLFANLSNIGLDLLFVAAWRRGVSGAALATALSQVLSAVLTLAYLGKKKLFSFKKLGFDRAEMKKILRLGLPIGTQSTLFPLSNVIVQSQINVFGVDYIAGWGICGKLDFLVWYIAEAFGASVAIFTAQNYGALRFDRIKKGVRSGLAMAFALVAGVSLALYLYRLPLAGLLVKDREVILKTGEMIALFAPFYPLYALCDIFPGAIKGTGESFRPMIITLVCTCLSRVLWVLAVPPSLKSFRWVLWCYPMSWILTSATFFIYYVFFMRKLEEKTLRPILNDEL